MKRRGQSTTFRLSIAFGCLLIGLALGACSGDDDDTTGGSSGGNSGGESGAMSIGGSAVGGASGSVASGTAGDSPGAGGNNDTSAAGQATGGSSVGGSSVGGSSGTGSSGGGSAGNGFYLPCASLADCKAYGGGKICCSQGAMQFCTKQSACTGKILP